LNQIDDQNDDCNYEQQMDQSAANVAEKTKKPENQENYKYRPQHNLIPVKFVWRLCATPQQEDQKQNRNGIPRSQSRMYLSHLLV